MTRFHRWSFVCLTLLGLSAAGCKQDNGERCEQPSDCSSGICGSDTTGGMTSAMGKTCQSTIGTPGVTPAPDDASASDAGTTTDATTSSSDAGDASDTTTSDASDAASAETGDATTTTDASDASDASASDVPAGATDAATLETGGDASADGGAGVSAGGGHRL